MKWTSLLGSGIVFGLLVSRSAAEEPLAPPPPTTRAPSAALPAAPSGPSSDPYPLRDWSEPPARHGCGHGFSAGASLYILQPSFGNNPAYTTTVNPGAANQAEQTTSMNWAFAPAQAYWLGWSGPGGLGLRGRYFNFEESSQTLTTNSDLGRIQPPANLILGGGVANFGSPGIFLTNGFGKDFLTFSSDLRVQSFDLEATLDVRRGDWFMQLAVGGRYLELAQGYRALLTNDGGGIGSELQALTVARNFTGGGPTIAFQANWQLAQTNFSLFGNVRGSLLVGRSTQNLSVLQSISDPGNVVGGNQVSTPTAASSQQTVLPVAELEVGLEYGFNLGRAHTFIRGAVVNQTYFDAGSASQSDGNLGLFGAQITIGLNF